MTAVNPNDLALQALQVCLCLHARKGARAITQLFDHALSPVGLKATQLSLLMVVNARNPIRIGDLAATLVTDSTTVSRTLKPLIGQNLLTVQPHPDDKRVKQVALTADGQVVLDHAMPLWQAAQTRVARHLGGAVVQTLLPTLDAAAALSPGAHD